MSNSESLIPLLQDPITSCKNEDVSICDLDDHILQIMFDAWWPSMNVGSKHPVAGNNS
jgi:hypothetical protein